MSFFSARRAGPRLRGINADTPGLRSTGPAKMRGAMLYFFNIFQQGAEIRDPEGTELPSWEAAQAEAAAIIAELQSQFPGQFGSGSVLEVVTACGKRVMARPIGQPISGEA